MGRGRAKAIQKKIARDLKYSSGGTDLDRLRAELSGGSAEHVPASAEDDEDEFGEDEFGEDEDDEDDD